MKVALVERGPTHILLEWLLTCISFRGWLFAMWVGVLFPPPSDRVGAGEMWWLGCAPEEKQSLGSSSPCSALLGRNLSGVSECQLWWTRVSHSHSATFGGWREAVAMITMWLLNQKVNL